MARQRPIEHGDIVRRFADRLREVRVSRGLTQLQLAEAAGIAVSYAGRLERAGAAPGIDLVARLADALGVSPHDLLPVSDPPDQLPVLQERARALFGELMTSADREVLQAIIPVLAKFAGGPSAGR